MMGMIFWLCAAGILYVYLGYPLILWTLAQLRRRRVLPAEITPSVTLLIAAYNEEEVIAAKLENCLALDYPEDLLQIIVAADGSNDRTVELVNAYASRGVDLSYDAQRQGKSAAINHAFSLVRNEIVIFSDANNLYEPRAIRELVRPFASEQVGLVSGSKLVIKGDGVLSETEETYWKYESFIKKHETRLSSCTGVSGEILAIRRSLFQPIPPSIINDDFYILMSILRQGYHSVYQPEAHSLERVSASAQDEITRRARISSGRFQAFSISPRLLPWQRPILIWQLVSHKFLRPFVPFAMIGALIANLGAVIGSLAAQPARPSSEWRALVELAHPYGLVFGSIQLLFYILAFSGNYFKLPVKSKRALYLPTYLVNSNIAALIGFVRFIARRQTPIWQRVSRRDMKI